MKQLILFAAALFFTGIISAQKLEVKETEFNVSKDVRKKGSYFGGGLNEGPGETIAIMNYNGDNQTLFDIYKFSADNTPLKPVLAANISQLAEHLNYKATDTDQKKEVSEFDGAKGLLIRSSFTGRNIVIEKGNFEESNETYYSLKPDNPFSKSKAWNIKKLEFNQTDKEKVKLRIFPIGTLVSEGYYDKDILATMSKSNSEAGTEAHGGSGLIGLGSAMVNQAKTGMQTVKAGLSSAFMKPGGKAVVIGRVEEKVKIGNPVPWNNNRLRTALVDGTSMTAQEKNTYIMPFAINEAASKAINNNNEMIMLLVPLNSPNTVKEAKQYQMGKENRNRVLAVVIDKHGDLKDSVEFRSAGNDGKYNIVEAEGGIYIPAIADASGNGFYNGLVRNPTHFQITKIQDGKLVYHKTYGFENITDKVSVPEGEKFKKIKMKDLNWNEHFELNNGDRVFTGHDQNNYYGFHINESGDLKKIYIQPRAENDSKVVDSRFINGGENLYWMSRETPADVGDVSVELQNQSTHSSGMYEYRTWDVVPRNFNEIKAIATVTKIDPQTGKMSKAAVLGGKRYLIIGDSGYIKDNKGTLRMIGFDMKKKKKLYSIIMK